VDIYEITTVDPWGMYHGNRRETRIGSRHKALQITAAVNRENAVRRYRAEKHGTELVPVGLTVRVAPGVEFTDVTSDFLPEGGE